MNYGGFWIRFVAYLVDSLIVTIGFVGVMLLISAMGLELAGAEIIFLVLAILYWALMQSSKRQATIGKSLCGLKVGGPNGERISVGRALGREAAKIISSLTMLIGFVIAAFTRNKQALHDFVASTYVVREGPSRVLAAVALAVLALFAPAIAVAMFGAGALTSVLGPMAALLEDPVAVQKPAAQAPKPAAPAAPAAPKPVAVAEAPKPAAPAPKPAAEAPKPAAEAPKPAAEAPKPVAEAPKPAPAPVATAPAAPAKPPEPAKSAPAPVKVAETAPVVEAPAKMEREPAPVIRAAVQDDAAPAPRIQVVAGPVIESKIRFNDLMTAVLYRDAGAVNDLLAFGKWPDKTDSSGMTPLMVAAQIGETAIAQALLKAGADPRRAGPGGQTALSIARERKDAAMLGLLQGGK